MMQHGLIDFEPEGRFFPVRAIRVLLLRWPKLPTPGDHFSQHRRRHRRRRQFVPFESKVAPYSRRRLEREAAETGTET